MSIAKFIDNLKHQTAKELTSELRSRALASGWDKDVVSNTRVEYTGGKMAVNTHPDYEERAFKHEFGTEHTRPTAVIRKLNNDREASKQVVSRAVRGGKK
jgi:hypothetical protein